MQKDETSWNSRIALKIDEETHNQIEILKKKHAINISALCRNAVNQMFVKLEGNNQEVN